MSIVVKFKWEDLWIGIYVEHVYCGGCTKHYHNFYICIIPMFPMKISFHRGHFGNGQVVS